ncbi:MAG: hypothetical protein ACKVG4_08835 [Longimicrobiales bacterium]
MSTPKPSNRPGRFLEWKVRIFGGGAVLALVGMYLGERWMTGLAILVLLTGLVIRVVLERNPSGSLCADDDDEQNDVGTPGSEA